MESALLLTGFAIGGALVLPVISDFLKEHLAFILMGSLLLIGLVLIAPYSAEVRALWKQVNVIPETLANAITYGQDEQARFTYEFNSAFHR